MIRNLNNLNTSALTLVEVLVTITLLTFIVAILAVSFPSALDAFYSADAAMDADFLCRSYREMLTRELRSAAVIVVDGTTLTLTFNEGGGTVSQSRYTWDGSTLLRETAGGGLADRYGMSLPIEHIVNEWAVVTSGGTVPGKPAIVNISLLITCNNMTRDLNISVAPRQNLFPAPPEDPEP
jgi:type II secretory pathway pseudopilin PulG